ncbi:hypothetical protein BsWGS_07736 [Bradybaena similaris]
MGVYGDIFAKYPGRVFGLGVAVGEALKYVVSPDLKNLCSAVACVYILCHASCQAFEARQTDGMVTSMYDALIFDGLASVLIPSFVTYHTSRITFSCLKESTTVPDVVLTWGPTVVGLCMLFLTTEPIDQYVNDALDDTVRKLYY